MSGLGSVQTGVILFWSKRSMGIWVYVSRVCDWIIWNANHLLPLFAVYQIGYPDHQIYHTDDTWVQNCPHGRFTAPFTALTHVVVINGHQLPSPYSSPCTTHELQPVGFRSQPQAEAHSAPTLVVAGLGLSDLTLPHYRLILNIPCNYCSLKVFSPSVTLA